MLIEGEKISFFVLIGIGVDVVSAMGIAIHEINAFSIDDEDFKKLGENILYNGTEDEISDALDALRKARIQKESVLLVCKSKALLHDFFEFIKVITPTNIQLYSTFDAHLNTEEKKYSFQDFKKSRYSDFRNLKIFPFEDMITFVSITKYFQKFILIKRDPIIDKLIQLYLEAEHETKGFVSFLLYVFTIEMLVDDGGQNNISYKFARFPAVLLGYDEEVSSLVYKNLKNIYGIRSKIVHNAKFDRLTIEIIEYLSYIISCIFITLLEIQINDPNKPICLKDLFKKANSLGFGNRTSLFIKSEKKNFNIVEKNIEKIRTDLFPKEKGK